MLKRVLIAVFVLGLVIGLNGTALSDVVKGSSAFSPVEKVNPNHPRVAEVSKAGPQQPTFKKPAEALEAKRLPAGIQVPYNKLNTFCDEQDYTSGAPAYFWTIPDAYGDDLFNMRFTSEAGMYCTLKTAWFLMYEPPMTGNPSFTAYLWDDDGFGFPGNKLDSLTIPWATIQAAAAATAGNLFYLGVDFPTQWVFTDGEEYNIGWTVSAGDTMAIISDAADGPYAGEARASEFYGTWGTMLNDWGLNGS